MASRPTAGRVRLAYRTALVVVWSYVWLAILSRIFGSAYYEARILSLHQRNAIRVKKAILQLQGLFIKVGQLLSILSNFLPESFQQPLEALQDQAPPRSFSEVEDRFVRSFGRKPEEIFARFDREPIASASIGQAHRAMLPDGREVVVKVQHADIDELARVDLEIIRRITRVISFLFAIKGMDQVYTQVKKMIEEELDFEQEANSMQRIREQLEGEQGILVPEVHAEFSNKKILTTTWHDGVKITDVRQLDAWGLDRKILLDVLLHAYCKMVFKDGFYHADPHPGNILVRKDGMVVLLDFGATGRLGQDLRQGIPKLIEAAVRNDMQAMVEACRSMGFLAEGEEAELVAEKMIAALRNFLRNEIQVEGLDFRNIKVNPFENSLYHLVRDIGIGGITGTVQVPKDYILLNRMMTLLLGICNTLDPRYNPLDVVRPYVQEYVLEDKKDILGLVRSFVQGTLVSLLALPDDLRKVLVMAKRGRLELRSPDIMRAARLARQTGLQVLYGIGILALAAISYWMYDAGDHRLSRYALGASGVSLLLFVRASWRAAAIR